MLAALNPFKTSAKQSAQKLYRQAVLQARKPVFYQAMSVPDTLDGRFDMISLHVIITLHALKRHHDKSAAKVSQALFDVMFVDMDKSLREMAIGDLSVPKHMKRMMNGFNGRMQNYDKAFEMILSEQGDDDLKATLIRNIYGEEQLGDQDGLEQLTKYVIVALKMAESIPLSEIIDGSMIYPDV